MTRVIPYLLVILSLTAEAAIDAYPFPNDELRERYNVLIAELRCPQCLNTNLAGSDSMIAKGLRREVHRMLLEGSSDEEILDFMQARYGDFILYEPRLKAGTFLLWFGPVILFLVAFAVALRIVRRSVRRDAEPLTEADRERLEQMVGKK